MRSKKDLPWWYRARHRLECWRWGHVWHKRKADGVTGCSWCLKGFK